MADQLYTKICENGKVYIPATTHYPKTKGASVSCDRCQREINICLGAHIDGKDYDLCMTCVDEINTPKKNLAPAKPPMGEDTIEGIPDEQPETIEGIPDEEETKPKPKPEPKLETMDDMFMPVFRMMRDIFDDSPSRRF